MSAAYHEEEGTSAWTHPMCELCWIMKEVWPQKEAFDRGDIEGVTVRVPTRVVEPDVHWCCFCDGPTISGIFVRADPAIAHDPLRSIGQRLGV